MRTLHELPRFSDRWSYVYLERGRLDVDAEGLTFHQAGGFVRVPVDQLALLMLGPGSTVTHAAVKSLARNNCLLAWTGEDGMRFYAAGTGGTYSARRLLRQAKLATDQRSRLEVAWRMYRFRFKELVSPTLSLESIRGLEGIRVRRAYGETALRYGVVWKGRKYDQEDWYAADAINRALSAASACLYGVCHAAIVAAGYSPGLGFIHTGKMLSFVYDVADLYKTELTIPVAFKVASQGLPEIERQVRRECREAFYEYKLMERLLPDIAEVLDVGDDSRECAEDLEGRIVTMDVGA